MDFIMYPPTVSALIKELISACDAYNARKITEQDLRTLIEFWATSSGDKLFDGANNYNPTVTQRLGKKRLKLVKVILSGNQSSPKISSFLPGISMLFILPSLIEDILSQLLTYPILINGDFILGSIALI